MGCPETRRRHPLDRVPSARAPLEPTVVVGQRHRRLDEARPRHFGTGHSRRICGAWRIQGRLPDGWEAMRDKMGSRCLQWGFADSKADYVQWLWRSTAAPLAPKQEYFGLAMVEAMRCDVMPWVPESHAYTETMPEGHRFMPPDMWLDGLRDQVMEDLALDPGRVPPEGRFLCLGQRHPQPRCAPPTGRVILNTFQDRTNPMADMAWANCSGARLGLPVFPSTKTRTTLPTTRRSSPRLTSQCNTSLDVGSWVMWVHLQQLVVPGGLLVRQVQLNHRQQRPLLFHPGRTQTRRRATFPHGPLPSKPRTFRGTPCPSCLCLRTSPATHAHAPCPASVALNSPMAARCKAGRI